MMETTTVQDNTAISIDVEGVMKMIPHRYPFLMIDRVVDLMPGRGAIGIKNVTINEPFFMGHFPSFPVMPGVLVIEAMGQTGGVLVLQDGMEKGNKMVLLAAIEEAKFRRPVVPGDQLRMEMEVLSWRTAFCRMRGKTFVDGELAVE